jgi:hypothetical protein
LKKALSKLIAIIVILCSLSVAIGVTESEIWLGIWLILFIYFGIPVLLLSIADLIQSFRGTPEKPLRIFAWNPRYRCLRIPSRLLALQNVRLVGTP